MRKAYLIAPLAAIIGLLFYFFVYDKTATDLENPIFTVVVQNDFSVSVTATGELKAKNSVKIRGARRMRDVGVWETTISRILPEGTVVKKGDWVASLDKSAIETKIDEASIEIEKFETQLAQAKIDTTIGLNSLRDQLSDLNFDVAEKELFVQQSQFEAKMVIQQAELDLQRIKRNLAQNKKNFILEEQKAKAKIAEINASYKQVKNRLAKLYDIAGEFDVMAPEDGMLIYISQWGGEKKAVGGRVSGWDPEVGELPDLTIMVSKTYVNEVDISKVMAGQEVKMGIDAFPDKHFDGKVTKVANIGQQLRNQDAKVFEIIVELVTSDSTLRPAMTTSNEIQVRSFPDALSIPLEALSQDSLSYVILENNGKPLKKEILIGQANEDNVIVVLGLNKGDKIYLHYSGNKSELKFESLDSLEKEKAVKKIDEATVAYRQIMASKKTELKDKKDFTLPASIQLN